MNNDWSIDIIFDGTLDSSHSAVTNLDEAEVARLTGVPVGGTVPIPVHAFLLRSPGATVVIDAGAGPNAAPALGNLPQSLSSYGVTPDQVDHVFLTHIHSDHTNGLLDTDGNATFPNAELVLHEAEANFWLGEMPAGASERLARNFGSAAKVTAPYRDRLRTVKDGEGLPGLAAMLMAGHTPGHTGWFIESAGNRLLVWGDIVHFAQVQVPVPDATLIYDVDPEAAVATRRKIFDFVATDGITVIGSHLSPAFARLERKGTDYVLISEQDQLAP